jgi:type I restriction enzyme S subunit
VTEEFDGCFVSGEYPTFDCNPTYITSEFLATLFQSPDIWKSVAQGSKGLGDRRQRVKVEQLLEFEISLPPLDWQDEVVRLGHRIADVKKLQEVTSLGLDAFLPSIFDEAFHGTH